MSGVAPHALLIPIRTTESVVLFSMRGLRQAVDHAATHGAHVVSISLGGPVPWLWHRNARSHRAVEAGTIVLAAAGNKVGFVVFPAAFDEVIAVAASNIRDEPWTGSSHGPAVDITAPGESVWRAQSMRQPSGQMAFAVGRGNGTSFAVATTAGVAALWISYHGWTDLVRRYGAGNVARVFKQLLQATCRTPRGWNTSEYGPGIVDARRLLAAPFPATAPARKFRSGTRASVAVDTTGIETIVHLCPDVARARVEDAVADLLHVPDRALPSILQELRRRAGVSARHAALTAHGASRRCRRWAPCGIVAAGEPAEAVASGAVLAPQEAVAGTMRTLRYTGEDRQHLPDEARENHGLSETNDGTTNRGRDHGATAVAALRAGAESDPRSSRRPLLRRPGAEGLSGAWHARNARIAALSRLVILHRSPGVSHTKVKAALTTLQEDDAIEFATPVLRDAASDTRQVLTDEIVLRLKPGQSARTLAAVKAEHGLTIGKRNEFEPRQYIVKVPRASGTHTLEVARSLDQRNDVEFASPNFLTTVKR